VLLSLGLDEFVYDSLQVTKADSIYFDQRSSIKLIMELLLRDINHLPAFRFLNIDQGSSDFWGLVEARRQIVRLETESFLNNEARRLIRQAQEKKDFEPVLEGMQNDVTNRRAPTSRKRSDTTKEKKNYCCLSGCNKTGTLSCPAPVHDYCEGRLFCSDHSRLHADHFGPGSKLKKPLPKSGSLVTTVQPEVIIENENAPLQVQIPATDILCAVAECDGLATKFCQRLSAKCNDRKFCNLHGELCARHAFQVFRTFQLAVGPDDSNDDVDDDDDDNGTIEGDVANDTNEQLNNERSDAIDMTTITDNINNPNDIVTTVDNWFEIIHLIADTYHMEPVEEEFRFGPRTIKTGCYLLYFHVDTWRIAKIAPSMRPEQFQVQFLESSDWLYDDLKIAEHGKCHGKWVLLRKMK